MAIRPIIQKPPAFEPMVNANDRAFDAQLKERQMLAFAGKSAPQTVSLLPSSSNGSSSQAPVMPAFLTQPPLFVAGVQNLPAKPDGPIDQEQAQADHIVADIIRGKSIDLIARQTLPHVKDSQAAREQILGQLRAAGLRVDAPPENNIGRTTVITDLTTGKTVTETHDLEKSNYTIEVKGRDGKEVSSSPLRDGLGRKQTSSRDEKTGAITTRYENDLGDGTVVERTSRPDGSAIEKTVRKDGKIDAWFISSTGHRTRLAGEKSVAEQNADQVKKAVFEDGTTIAQVARNRRMTESEVIALLKSGGVRIGTTEPTSDNGDTKLVKIVNPATNKMVIEGYDYHHDEPYRQVIDGNDVFDVKVLDPSTGETTRMKIAGAAGYAQKLANDQHSTVANYETRIRQLGNLIRQARKEGEPTAGLEKERTQLRATFETAKVDEGVAQGRATSILAATQQAETGKIVGEAYERVQKTRPGTVAHERAKEVLDEILGFADRVDRNVDAADKNLRLLETGQDWLKKETVRKQAWADLQEAFQQFKERMQWGGLDNATIERRKREGVPHGPYRVQSDEKLWQEFEKAYGLDGAIDQPVWRAYTQASDGALRARVALGDAALAKTAADRHLLEGEGAYLRRQQQEWTKAHPNEAPANSPFQKALQYANSQIGDRTQRYKKLAEDPAYNHDKHVLSLPDEQRLEPEKLRQAEVDYVRENAQINSAEIQELQAKLGGPITGRDSARVRAMVEALVRGMGEAGREVDVQKVVTQILRSPQINGDDPDNAGDLTVRPIVMRYDEPGVSITTGLFEVKNRDGEIHYVDMTGKVFDSRQDFLDNNNQFKEQGILVMPTRLDTNRRPDGTIAYEAVKAQNDSAWEKWVDPIVGIGTAIATVASFTPAAPVAAPLAFAGGAYLGGRALIGQVNHLEHGGSWGDKESVMNMLSIATTALPFAAGGVRTAGLLARTELTASQAAKGGFGAIRAKDATLGLGKARVHLPKTSYADDVGRHLQSGGKLNAAARGMDGAAIVAGVPLIGESAYQLAAHGSEMSGLELANSVASLGTGIAGAGLGARGLRASRSPTTDLAGRETSRGNSEDTGSPLDEAAFDQVLTQARPLLDQDPRANEPVNLNELFKTAKQKGYRFGISHQPGDPASGSNSGIDVKAKVITIDRRYASEPGAFLRSLGRQLLRVPELKYMERRAPQDVVGWISIKSNVGQPHLVQSGDATVIRPERRASIEPPEKLLFRGERREHANWSDDGLHPRVPLQELTAEQALEYSLVVHDEADLRASPTTELPAIAKDLYASPIGEPGAEGHVYVLKDPGNGYNINKLLEEKQQHSHLSWEREHMLRDIPPEYIIGRRRVENGRFVGEFEYNPNAVWRIDIGGGRSVPVKEVRGSFPETPDAVFVPQKAGHTDRFAQDVSGKPRFTHELVQDQVTKKYFIQPIEEASE